jgi:hypothetical protein
MDRPEFSEIKLSPSDLYKADVAIGRFSSVIDASDYPIVKLGGTKLVSVALDQEKPSNPASLALIDPYVAYLRYRFPDEETRRQRQVDEYIAKKAKENASE